jgi:anti-sigma regulatory factor (Ser/Thr protein kinase)
MISPVAATSFGRELPFTSEAPSIARGHLRRFAGDRSAALVEDAVLMVSELVTNAVAHGQPAITLHLRWRTDRLIVAVADLGEAPLACAVPRLQASGRGLVIVEALATRWGISQGRGGSGKQVWFELGGLS